MSGLDKTILNFTGDGLAPSGVIAVGAASVSQALPVGTELLMLTCSAAAAHFRVGVGTITAVGTDPMITQGITLVARLNPSMQYNLAVIQDGAATGNVAWCKVAEG